VTIRKGRPWGITAPLPADGVIAASDAAARHIVQRARELGTPPPTIGLTGGDLWRTLGAPRGGDERLRSRAAATFPVDLGIAVIGGREQCFLAHALVGTRLRTRGWLALNAQWMGELNVGPRAHPNDGLLDVYDWRLGLGELMKVRARARQGAHLPHPGITQLRTADATVDFGARLHVWLDGERVARTAGITVRVEPDALTIVV
jgi:hypothetical protein